MSTAEPSRSWEPRYPLLIAIAICTIAALSLCWPILQGQFIGGQDQVDAGYSFRLFGAQYFKQYGSIPQWNPFLFGGMPFSAVIGHGDIFYPTAWLRWFVPVGFGMSFGFFFHIALAGVSMYALVRGLGLSWTAAIVAGVAYQLSGNVSSMLNNGHDGKLFVAALAPFAFLALLNAVRHGRRSGYGILAIVIGLAILSPAVQVAYYLMVACGLFALWLVFLDPQRRQEINPFTTLSAALGSVLLGLGISMIQIFQILSHVRYTPRAEGGPSGGWEYATSYSYHLKEIPVLFLPEFNGLLGNYVGVNPVKSHTEYLGVVLLVLAILGISAARQRKLLLPFAVIAGLFFLISIAADTPFYSLWYHMPMMKQVRAAGMAFYLVGLCTAILAAFGVERILAREVPAKSLYIALGVFGGIGLLGAAGGLIGLASQFARPDIEAAVMSSPEFATALREGAVRLLVFVALGGAVLFSIQRGMLRGVAASLLLVVAVGADSWSVLRHFSNWLPPAEEYYVDDPVIATLKSDLPMPFRVYDPTNGDENKLQQLQVYHASTLMAHEVPTLFGYHGMESFYFDSLLGSKGRWGNQLNPVLWDLYALNFILMNQEPPEVAGYHKVLGPVPTDLSQYTRTAFLLKRDTLASWVRVVPRAVKVPQAQLIPTLLDPAFPHDRFLLFSDTTAVEGTVSPAQDSAGQVVIPAVSPIHATLAEWKPGAMTVRLEGSDSVINWLLVSENWYPDWHATVDGNPAPTIRADHALLSVAIPPGAKEISLVFDVAEYHQGKWITLVSALLALTIIATARLGRRTADA